MFVNLPAASMAQFPFHLVTPHHVHAHRGTLAHGRDNRVIVMSQYEGYSFLTRQLTLNDNSYHMQGSG